jgi:hypothetical protein
VDMYDSTAFSGSSFLVDKSFECENASEKAVARFVQPAWLIAYFTYDSHTRFILQS